MSGGGDHAAEGAGEGEGEGAATRVVTGGPHADVSNGSAKHCLSREHDIEEWVKGGAWRTWRLGDGWLCYVCATATYRKFHRNWRSGMCRERAPHPTIGPKLAVSMLLCVQETETHARTNP